jgi:hypothetical protein
MTIALYLLVCSIGVVLALRSLVRTPDPDRPRAYPHQPDRWQGIGLGGGIRDALGSSLFYSLAAAVFGAVGAILGAWMPLRAGASLGSAIAAGVAVSGLIARRMVRTGSGAMRRMARSPKTPVGRRPRVLFICGSPNQTTQMHAIARAMPDVEAWFTPYYADDWFIRSLVKLGWVESAILGFRRRGLCLDYLNEHGLSVDLGAERNVYDMAVTCNDQVLPSVLAETPWVLVQEGIQEPPTWRTALWRRTRAIPAPLAGTAAFGLSNRYMRFCVASEGYRDRYVVEGIPADKIVVTGIPNFDNFARFRDNSFPHRGYVLVCTSDARETLLSSDRRALLERTLAIAAGRPLLFKLHPNERVDRATREILSVAPEARIFAQGCAEEMVANCDVLITEWSSLTFCGVALGKEVHSWHSLDQVARLLPVQHGKAAARIGAVVRESLESRGRSYERQVAPAATLAFTAASFKEQTP